MTEKQTKALLRKLKRIAAESHRRWTKPTAESFETRYHCGKEQGLIEAIQAIETLLKSSAKDAGKG